MGLHCDISILSEKEDCNFFTLLFYHQQNRPLKFFIDMYQSYMLMGVSMLFQHMHKVCFGQILFPLSLLPSQTH
jgi:hypothetical protein